MKVSDYIVNFLISNNVKDIFGYPGGMVTYLMDSLNKYKDKISDHLCYHEQAAAFAACANAQLTDNIGCAYATSGPGATNLMTGICQAYFDSIPTLFITGQVNTNEAKGNLSIRQRGFQELDIVSMVKSVTKYAVHISEANEIKEQLKIAVAMAKSGRPGPVLIDIPIDIFRAIIEVDETIDYRTVEKEKVNYDKEIDTISKELVCAKRPIILAGAGINTANARDIFRKIVDKIKMPVVTSMIAIDLLPKNSEYNFGFVGAYGHRYANFAIMNSDLIIAIGSRIDFRQTGTNINNFAPNAKIIRLDVDAEELKNHIKPTDINIECDLRYFLNEVYRNLTTNKKYSEWIETCQKYREKLSEIDKNKPNDFVKEISKIIDEEFMITTDVGQNQVWISQSFENKKNQRILFSGGLGSMGYSLPAAIGAYYASKKKIIAFCGDGGIQMNIQELQFLAREQIPVKIIVLNNASLGMIRHFQEMYFDSKFVQTVNNMGYAEPDFCSIAKSYGIESISVKSINDIKKIHNMINNSKPIFINVDVGNTTYVYPKLAVNKPIDDQDPLMDRELYSYLKKL